MIRTLRWGEIVGALLACLLLWVSPAGSAHATVTCSATMQDVSFGSVDIVNNAGLTTSAQLQYTCSNDDSSDAVNVSLCAAIDGGQGHQRTLAPSYMTSGASSLYFNLLLPDDVTVWGSRTYGTTEYTATLSVPAATRRRGTTTPGTASGAAVINGNILTTNNAAAVPGAYADSFANGSTALTYTSANSPRTPASCTSGTQQSVRFPFTVSATVIKSCKVGVSASTLDFGSVPGTATNVSATGTGLIDTTCSNTTPYIVGLQTSDGTAGTGHMTSSASADKVPYGLYRDSAHANLWGSSGTGPGSPGNEVPGIGTGSVQALTVYGNVPSANFTPGTYRDTVTVDVTY